MAKNRETKQASCVGDSSALKESIVWILENRRGEDGKRISQAALCRAAGMPEKWISGILKGRQSEDLKEPSAINLARAANVRVAWLRHGVGPREPFVEPAELAAMQAAATTSPAVTPTRVVERDDIYPSRAPIVAMARRVGIDPAAIDALIAEAHSEGDPGTEYWKARLRDYMKDVRELRQEAANEESKQANDPNDPLNYAWPLK